MILGGVVGFFEALKNGDFSWVHRLCTMKPLCRTEKSAAQRNGELPALASPGSRGRLLFAERSQPRAIVKRSGHCEQNASGNRRQFDAYQRDSRRRRECSNVGKAYSNSHAPLWIVGALGYRLFGHAPFGNSRVVAHAFILATATGISYRRFRSASFAGTLAKC